jgi:hypothetical protein
VHEALGSHYVEGLIKKQLQGRQEQGQEQEQEQEQGQEQEQKGLVYVKAGVSVSREGLVPSSPFSASFLVSV